MLRYVSGFSSLVKGARGRCTNRLWEETRKKYSAAAAAVQTLKNPRRAGKLRAEETPLGKSKRRAVPLHPTAI